MDTFQGIRNVISACWEVSDDTTMFLVINGHSKPYTPFADPHHPEGPKPDRSY
jgi:hypothetical protein